MANSAYLGVFELMNLNWFNCAVKINELVNNVFRSNPYVLDEESIDSNSGMIDQIAECSDQLQGGKRKTRRSRKMKKSRKVNKRKNRRTRKGGRKH